MLVPASELIRRYVHILWIVVKVAKVGWALHLGMYWRYECSLMEAFPVKALKPPGKRNSHLGYNCGEYLCAQRMVLSIWRSGEIETKSRVIRET